MNSRIELLKGKEIGGELNFTNESSLRNIIEKKGFSKPIIHEDALYLHVTGPNPSFTLSGLHLDLDKYDSIIIRLKVKGLKECKIYWQTDTIQMAEGVQHLLNFYLSEKYYTYVIPIGEHVCWKNILKKLKFSFCPYDCLGAHVYLDFVALCHTKPQTASLSKYRSAVLKNKHFYIKCQGPIIADLRVDPKGNGIYSENLLHGSLRYRVDSRLDQFGYDSPLLNGEVLHEQLSNYEYRITVPFDGAAYTYIVSIDENKIKLSFNSSGEAIQTHDFGGFIMDIPFVRDGYEVSPESSLFWTCISDEGWYIPAQQLKRMDYPAHIMRVKSKGMLFKGWNGIDLKFEGQNDITWHMYKNHIALELRDEAIEKRRVIDESSSIKAEVSLSLFQATDNLPEYYPVFESCNLDFQKLTNRLYYERAYGFPSVGFTGWRKWNALTWAWNDTPLNNSVLSKIEDVPMDSDGYVWVDIKNRGWPYPGHKEDNTKHFTTNGSLIMAAHTYFMWTRDFSFLESNIKRIRKALDYYILELGGANGIIIIDDEYHTGKDGGLSTNYWDVLPFGYKDAYSNIYYYEAILGMIELEEAMGEGEKAADLRKLSYIVKESYNKTFWDKDKGRYVGCIDADGNVHDYGFTFVNLEAAYAGLANKSQVVSIYDWLENKPTSTGKKDTYTQWIFSPRATTEYNPPSGWWDRLWWFGKDEFGVQIQDGGASFYTSFYDIMTRIRYLGKENAYIRYKKILERFALPDHLCGGTPLYRGERPQHLDPGAVGLDIPFPESGLVPTVVLYGFMGVKPDAKGLLIKPNIPEEVKFIGVKNLFYNNMILDLYVYQDQIWVKNTYSEKEKRYGFSEHKHINISELNDL